jgi:hypothetical protein
MKRSTEARFDERSPKVTGALTRTEGAILNYLVNHPTATHADIAKALRLSREHVTRLLNRDPLASRLAEAHRDVFAMAKASAALSSWRVVHELQEIVLDGRARNADRIRAATVLLGLSRPEAAEEATFDFAAEHARAVIEAWQRRREALRDASRRLESIQ